MVGLKAICYLLLFATFLAFSSYLFFPLASYAIYKRSAEHYLQIESKIITSSFGVKVKNRQSKTTQEFMGEWCRLIQQYTFTHLQYTASPVFTVVS